MHPSILDSEIFRTSSYTPKVIRGEEFQLADYPYLDVVMTDRCNSKCKFCIGDLLHDKIDGDLESFTAQIDHVVRNLNVREILLLGGEPTIAPMLFPLLEWLGGDFRRQGGLRMLNKVCMTSNGKKLKDPEFRAKLFRHGIITHLNLSLMSLDSEQQNFIHGSRSNVTLEDLQRIWWDCLHYGVNLRINTNVYKTNNDTSMKMFDFIHSVDGMCNSIKFSPLLQTDSFSVIPEVNEFNREYILTPDTYEELFNSTARILGQDGGLTIHNPNTFGFVEYTMVTPGKGEKLNVPVIFNYNHRGRMLHQATVYKQINNIKLLPNGNLSRSWNREELDHVIRFDPKKFPPEF